MNDGGSAFPCYISGFDGGIGGHGGLPAQRAFTSSGMSLRDYFAIEVLKAVILRSTNDATNCIPYLMNGDAVDRTKYILTAYQYADAMLTERIK